MSKLDLPLLQRQLQPYQSEGRTALLPALQAVQEIYGYIPEDAAKEIGRALGVPLADIYGVIEFYSLFYPQPVGSTVVHICTDIACALHGGEQMLEDACRRFGIQEGETSADGFFTIQRSPCLGLCEHAPAALVGQSAVGQIDRYPLEQLLAGEIPRPQGVFGGTQRRLTANCGKGRPASLTEYLASGGYAGLRRALSLTPAAVIAEIKESGLVGRGGAAFPTGLKWEGAAQAPGEPKYVVCNADESEPGTFKDRGLMEEDPHRTLEGMIIAGYAIGASKGYIYVRGEYPHAYAALSHAVSEAQAAGFLGKNILGSGFDCEIELRRGAGAYICGEETALFESIEGKRGFPRLKPPFPTTHGLFGKPTVINNVETLCNVPLILANGAAAYRQIGTEKSPGSKLFCLSGDVKSPGIYEALFGISLRTLLYDLAGGMRTESPLQAVLIGGAAGAFATPAQLDVEMSFEALKSAGLPLGSGVILALDQTRDLRRVMLNLAHFFAHESCGKCYPCQIGTQRQLEILERLADAKPLQGDPERLADVGWTMSDASLCGLGQTAATAVLSAMRIWPELFGASQ
ncbi:MAG: NADH-quinone oxidoreductase subunit F [Anaerolineae bacterium UTCFX2]|jgi:NADH-quinone oxidoreductase subunit F|nr:MAG: NADH-quinone oxidoreductase subunit F [Anaerolineae bacterium UTCFX2]